MRARLGWVVTALGALVALLGLAVMVLLGPDSRFSTGPHPIDTDGIAIVTKPKVISWANVQVDLLAEVPVRKPIFVGIGNSVDVQNYVGKTARLEVTSFRRPWDVSTREVKGRPNLPGAPTALDWWIVQSAGLGGASVSTRLPDETVSAAILAVGSTNLSGLEVTLAYGVKGGFYQGVGLLLLGLAGVWSGTLVRRGATAWADEAYETDEAYGPVVAEEVVYVYVDEDGVEHEMTAEEARQYDVVEETVEVVEVEPEPEPEAGPDAEPEPERDVAPAAEPVVPQVPGVLTAAEIAAGQEPEPAPEPAPETGDDRVVYVYVDEDGVEHEVGEDELGQFEIVDDEDES